MSFYLKYELSRLIHADGAKTFQAVAKSSRQNVLLHLVDKAASPELVEKVKRLETGRDGELVEVGEFAGSYYVVTRPIEDFQGLEQWLDMRVSDLLTRPMTAAPAEQPSGAPPKPPAAPSAPPPKEGPGEFTRLFGGGAQKTPATPLGEASPASPPSRPEPTTTPRPELRPPTSPTMLDPVVKGDPAAEKPAAAKPVAPAAPPPAPTAAPPAAPAGNEGPGAFTQMFEGGSQPASRPGEEKPAPERSPEPPKAPPAAQGPGEFTKLFGDSPASEPKPAPAAPSPSPTPAQEPPAPESPAAGAKPGEFTAMFADAAEGSAPAQQRPEPSSEPAASGTPVEKSSGEFTRLFGGGQKETAPRLKPTHPPKGGDIEKSSGEFTRLFGPDGKGSKPQSKPEPAAAKPQYAPDDAPLGASAGGPGDFTLMFGGGSSGSSGPPTGFGGEAPLAPPSQPPSFSEGLVGEISGDEALNPSQGQRASKSSKPFRAPGDFTRMFGPSDPSQQQAEDFVPAAQRSSEGYASGLFKNPTAAPPASQGSPPAPGAAGGGETQTAGDYTQMFERGEAQQGPAAQPAPAPAATTPADPPPKTGPSKRMLIALIVAVVVAGLSLGAAVYLFLNRDSGPDAEDPPAAEQQVEQPADSN